MVKWNDLPFNESATPAEKALEFDLQIQENGGPTLAETQAEIDQHVVGDDD